MWSVQKNSYIMTLAQNLEAADSAAAAIRCINAIGKALTAGDMDASDIGLGGLCKCLPRWLVCPLASPYASALTTVLASEPDNRRRLCEAGACSAMLAAADEGVSPGHALMLFRAMGVMACDHLSGQNAGRMLWRAVRVFEEFDTGAEAVGVLCKLGHDDHLLQMVSHSDHRVLVAIALRYLMNDLPGVPPARAIRAALSALSRLRDHTVFCGACAFICHVVEVNGRVDVGVQEWQVTEMFQRGIGYGYEETCIACLTAASLDTNARTKELAFKTIAVLFSVFRSEMSLAIMVRCLEMHGADAVRRSSSSAAVCESVVRMIRPYPETALKAVAALCEDEVCRSMLGDSGACEEIREVAGHARLVREAADALGGSARNAKRLITLGIDFHHPSAASA